MFFIDINLIFAAYQWVYGVPKITTLTTRNQGSYQRISSEELLRIIRAIESTNPRSVRTTTVETTTNPAVIPTLDITQSKEIVNT